MTCGATADRHCCWVDGEVCQFFENVQCTLRAELGSWEAVYTDPRYLRAVQPMWDRLALGKGCGDWPLERCEECGAEGD